MLRYSPGAYSLDGVWLKTLSAYVCVLYYQFHMEFLASQVTRGVPEAALRAEIEWLKEPIAGRPV